LAGVLDNDNNNEMEMEGVPNNKEEVDDHDDIIPNPIDM
jgi:hypothetical protein